MSEAIYRNILTVALLISAFAAFPEHRWPVGCAVLLFTAAVRAIIANQERLDSIKSRLDWTESLTLRFALVEMHNLSLRQEHAEIEWDGTMPVWTEARRLTLEDLNRFDMDHGDPTGADKPKVWWLGIVQFLLTAAGDAGAVGLSLLLTPN